MKKLMTAMAICAAASYTLAAGSVTSANVVGYSALAPYDAFGNIWGGQQFAKVGGGSQTLSTFLSGTALNYGDTIQIFNNATSLFVGYAWNGTHWEDGDLNRVGIEIPDIAMPAGKGFFITTTAAVKLSGEVINSNVTHTIKSGYNLITSAFPVAFNLNNCSFSSLSYGDQIQIFNKTTKQFDGIAWNGTGWEDGDLNPVTGVIATMGESFFLVAGANTTFLQNTPLN